LLYGDGFVSFESKTKLLEHYVNAPGVCPFGGQGRIRHTPMFQTLLVKFKLLDSCTINQYSIFHLVPELLSGYELFLTGLMEPLRISTKSIILLKTSIN